MDFVFVDRMHAKQGRQITEPEDGSPQLGSRGEASLGVWGTKSPESDTLLLSVYPINSTMLIYILLGLFLKCVRPRGAWSYWPICKDAEFRAL